MRGEIVSVGVGSVTVFVKSELLQGLADRRKLTRLLYLLSLLEDFFYSLLAKLQCLCIPAVIFSRHYDFWSIVWTRKHGFHWPTSAQWLGYCVIFLICAQQTKTKLPVIFYRHIVYLTDFWAKHGVISQAAWQYSWGHKWHSHFSQMVWRLLRQRRWNTNRLTSKHSVTR